MPNKIAATSVFDAMNQLLLSGELAPGSIVSEVGLAERFGVSRTPVREAIRQLAQNGLITLRPRQRPVVAMLSLPDALDQFEALAMLEADCCELAARRRTAEALARVEALHEACGRDLAAGSVTAYFETNEEFHRALSEASGNRYLAQRATEMRQRLRSLRAPRASEADRMSGSYREHSAIVDAIAARDPEAARAAMHQHVNMVGDRASDLIREYTRRLSPETVK